MLKSIIEKALNKQMGSNVIEWEIIAESTNQPIKVINHAESNQTKSIKKTRVKKEENAERAEA